MQFLQGMNGMDLILGGILLFSALVGISRGLIKELLSLVAWTASIWVAYHFAEPVATNYVQQIISDRLISYVAAFGGLFFLSLFAVGLLNILLSSLLDFVGLTGFDRLLGVLFGLARGAIICSLIVFFGVFVPALTKEKFWQESTLVPHFIKLADWGVSKLPANIRALIDIENNPDTVGVIPKRNENDTFHPSNRTERLEKALDLQLESLDSDPAEQQSKKQNDLSLESMEAYPEESE